MSKHTPGPWQLVGDTICGGSSPTAFAADVATLATRAHVPGEREANARLIAAAPKLLAACQDLADRLRRLSSHTDDVKACSEAYAAIAQARGEAVSQ